MHIILLSTCIRSGKQSKANYHPHGFQQKGASWDYLSGLKISLSKSSNGSMKAATPWSTAFRSIAKKSSKARSSPFAKAKQPSSSMKAKSPTSLAQACTSFQPATYPSLLRSKVGNTALKARSKQKSTSLTPVSFTNLKWGTANPIMMRDKDFGVLRLRGFGTYAMRVVDAGNFLKEHVASSGHLDADAITGHLRNLVVSRFADSLGELEIPALDLAAKYDEIAFDLQQKLNTEFQAQGLALENMAIENISLPPEVESALDKRSQMAVIGDMGRFTQFQTANAIPTAAANDGIGGAGMAMGMGFGMGNMMTHQMGQAMYQGGTPQADAFSGQMGAPAATAAPPAPASQQASPQERLQKIATLLEQGLISAEEAQGLRAKVLESLI